ncbi:hypothetical protein FHX15_003728 [Rhizobium sp. BK650]|nr:hypothetical protein [Rhizobium sp. BK650]
MWHLIITVLFYGDPSTATFNAALESVAFSSKAKCEAARVGYRKELGPIAKAVEQEVEAEKQVGQIKGATGLLVSAICVAQ